jgi:hypothetical protein
MTLQAALAAHHLTVLGGFHPNEEDGTPPGTKPCCCLARPSRASGHI